MATESIKDSGYASWEECFQESKEVKKREVLVFPWKVETKEII